MLQTVTARYKRKLAGFINNHFINRYNAAHSLENWFYHWLYFQNFSQARNYGPKNCYYEFGTGWGGTLTSFLKACTRFCSENNFDIHKIKIVLFDSFEGLPEIKAKEDDHPEWGKGKFAHSENYIAQIIRRHGFPMNNVTFIKGFYENTLNEATLARVKENLPSIITVDVDYYSSTKLVMDFIVPLLKTGSVFYFDDIYSFSQHPGMGQIKAITEFNEKQTGQLNWLTVDNFSGQCYVYSAKDWEFESKR